MRFDALTLFPDMFDVVSEAGVTGRAHKQGIWRMRTWNPRDYTTDVHRTVDDRPYGGGPGMVMLADPLNDALDQALADRGDSPEVILLSPTGRRFDQTVAQELAQGPGAVLVCGRYEGIDQRFIDARVTQELSLGDFVLSGGEIASLAIIDSVIRLLPGVLNDADSARQDSFHADNSGLLDSPHYTRPEVYRDQSVPEVLLSGHHGRIQAWRREQSLRLTALRRPDLIVQARLRGELSKADERFLASLDSGMLP
ncbi:tRNA (guanosine(37)-N1)-methyltransferase TrmD [Alcaligenes aquatilis]|uniref:tRNA (guanosine(37)-N1)-methyltransferase TrmD n=1 Tax=Alcaligenes aquatilis TaxID=323284 RepID=UPI000F690949|nr:tRNA (guanosine(37)-N1)-methyltransferase TrmD [Alcaligenes aquatilis]QXR34566.1 tRNA (guanosine(37)-N1)-methyltransferase TrmD [Alcaligenes aquatilis]